MTPIHLFINIGLVISMMFLGQWLESINGIRGWEDKFFTPWPMGATGLLIGWLTV